MFWQGVKESLYLTRLFMIGYYIYRNKLFLGKYYPFFYSPSRVITGQGERKVGLLKAKAHTACSMTTVSFPWLWPKGIGKNLATMSKDYGLRSE